MALNSVPQSISFPTPSLVALGRKSVFSLSLYPNTHRQKKKSPQGIILKCKMKARELNDLMPVIYLKKFVRNKTPNLFSAFNIMVNWRIGSPGWFTALSKRTAENIYLSWIIALIFRPSLGPLWDLVQVC